jgi:hypothetical protein
MMVRPAEWTYSFMLTLNKIRNPIFFGSSASQNITLVSGKGRERHGGK